MGEAPGDLQRRQLSFDFDDEEPGQCWRYLLKLFLLIISRLTLRRFHLRTELLARLRAQAKVSNASVRALQSQCNYPGVFWSFRLCLSDLLDVNLLKALRPGLKRYRMSAEPRHMAAKVPQRLRRADKFDSSLVGIKPDANLCAVSLELSGEWPTV